MLVNLRQIQAWMKDAEMANQRVRLDYVGETRFRAVAGHHFHVNEEHFYGLTFGPHLA